MKTFEPMAEQSYCGIDCTSCRLYIATLNEDLDDKVIISKDWHRLFGWPLNPQHMNCLGCKSSVVFESCSNCGIKACAQQLQLDVCTSCVRNPCEKIHGLKSRLMVSNPSVRFSGSISLCF